MSASSVGLRLSLVPRSLPPHQPDPPKDTKKMTPRIAETHDEYLARRRNVNRDVAGAIAIAEIREDVVQPIRQVMRRAIKAVTADTAKSPLNYDGGFGHAVGIEDVRFYVLSALDEWCGLHDGK
jgi:hypothetical protein